EAFDREMADAAARPRQEQSAARLVIVRGWHWNPQAAAPDGSSWIKPRLAPRLTQSAAAEFDAVVQAVGPVLPELDDQGTEPKARPVRRTRHRADGEFRHVQRHRFFERHAAFQRSRLLA